MSDKNNHTFSDDSNVIEKEDQELFESIAEKYAHKDYTKSSSIARKYQLMFAVMPVLKKLKSEITIVDIACGIGAPAKYLKGFYHSYIGIDYSVEMIKIAQSLYPDDKDVRFIASNIKDVKELEVKADLILAVGALHHMTEIDIVMESLKRIAGPGAYFVALEPQRGNPIVQLLRWLRGKIDRSYSESQRYFNRKELYDLMVENGMIDIETAFQGYLSPPLAQVVFQPQFLFAPLSSMIIWVDKFLDLCLPNFLRIFSWNIVVRCRFP